MYRISPYFSIVTAAIILLFFKSKNMDVFNLLLAVVILLLSLTSNKITWLIKIILSGVTAFYTLKTFYPQLRIYEPAEYSLKVISEFFKSGMYLRSFGLLIFYFLFFYYGIKLFLNWIFNSIARSAIQRLNAQITKWGNRSVDAFMIKFSRKMAAAVKRNFPTVMNATDLKNLTISHFDFLSVFTNLLSLSIHLVIAGILLNLNTKTFVTLLVIILILIPVLVLFLYPFVILFLQKIKTAIQHEYLRP